MKTQLLNKIQERRATVIVVGLGYVGLPIAVGFADAGFNVVGIDVDASKVDLINAGTSYIPDVEQAQLATLVESGHLRASSNFKEIQQADAVSICVPTPLRKTKDPDMSYVVSAIDSIAPYSHQGMVIILESTTYPGTTEEIIAPRIVQNGLEAGKDIFIAFSPERIDPGNKRFTVHNTPKVIGGMSAECTEVACELYSQIVEEVIPVSSPTTAEMAKLLENTFRAVNIALVNEMALICHRLGVDVWEVIEAAASKPFGFMPFYPGPGLGGHCIPVDPHYLSWKMKTLNYNARFIELASEINTYMPIYVVTKIADALNDVCKPIRGSRILVLGVAYKRDIDDVRESPALDVIQLLREKGAIVLYHDPFVPSLQLPDRSYLKSIDYSCDALADVDAVVITTDHTQYDWHEIAEYSQLIIDTRNATRQVNSRTKVVSI